MKNGTAKRPQRSNEPEFLDPPQSVQDALTLGAIASQATQNDAFMYAHSLVTRQLQADWAATTPDEKMKRDGLYWTLQGMNQYVGMLNAFIQTAVNLQSQADAAAQAENENYQGAL